MDREVNTKTVVIVLTFFICIIIAWAYFNTLSLSADAPSFIKKRPNGNLIFQLGNDYYETTHEGIDVHHFSLNLLGIKRSVGDFDLFNNGDLLVYATSYETSFKDDLEVYGRVTESDERTPSNNEGFYRCDVYKNICSNFGKELPLFSRGFRLAIDPDDNVYIADTSRHRLIKVNASGDKIATLDKGLKFPNDLYWLENRLWIANTNYHQILEIDSTTANFGERIKSFEASLPNRKFPVNFERVGDKWLVLSMNNNMQRGKLARFSLSGEQIDIVDIVDVERGADLIGVTYSEEQMILPDFKNLRYRSLNVKSLKPTSDFSSIKIDAHLTKSRASVSLYSAICWSLIGVGSLGFILLTFFALKLEVKAIKTDLEQITEDTSLDIDFPEGVREYWIPKSSQFTKVQKSLRWFIPLSVMIMMTLMITVMNDGKPSTALLVAVFMSFALFYFTWSLLKKTSEMSLGISKNGILIRDHLGNIDEGKGAEISVSSSTILLKNTLVLKKIFDIKEYEVWVQPRLRNAKKVGEVQVMIKQWEIKHPALIEPLKISFIALLMVVMMEWVG